MDNSPVFFPNAYYQIENRGIADENIFKNDRDYNYFMDCMNLYMSKEWELVAWCLLPDRYAIIVQIKESDIREISEIERSLKISRQYGGFISHYAKEFNRCYERRGNLFTKNLRRFIIEDDLDLRKKIIDLHLQPCKNNFVVSPFDWKFSSFNKEK